MPSTIEYAPVDYDKCPNPYLKAGFRAWVEEGQTAGHFIMAVLRNDLKEACFQADEKNLGLLKEIIEFAYWELPSNCWGSTKKMTKWKARFINQDTSTK